MPLERDAVVIETRAVSDTDKIIAMTASGVVIRTRSASPGSSAGAQKLVRVMRLDEKDKVVGGYPPGGYGQRDNSPVAINYRNDTSIIPF